jgi:type I restriction enzyme, S subunit
VSELPKGWALTALGQLVTVNYGRALPEQLRNPLGSAPVVGSSGVVGKHDAALVEHEAIVVGRKGAAGAVHLMEQPFWPIDTAYYILPPKGLHARWVAHYLGSRQLGRLDKSTAIPSLSRDDLYREQVPVAPSNEQLRIVAKLEELLSDLDAGVAELKAAQKKLAQYRQSLLKAAVEGPAPAHGDRRATAGAHPHRTPRALGSETTGQVPGPGQDASQGLAEEIPRARTARYHRAAGVAGGVGVGVDRRVLSCRGGRHTEQEGTKLLERWHFLGQFRGSTLQPHKYHQGDDH